MSSVLCISGGGGATSKAAAAQNLFCSKWPAVACHDRCHRRRQRFLLLLHLMLSADHSCVLTDSWATKTFILGVFFEKRKKSKKWYYIRSVEKELRKSCSGGEVSWTQWWIIIIIILATKNHRCVRRARASTTERKKDMRLWNEKVPPTNAAV